MKAHASLVVKPMHRSLIFHLWAAMLILLNTECVHSQRRLVVPQGQSGGWSFHGNQTLLAESYSKTASIVNLATGTIVQTFHGHTEPVWATAFSLDGTKAATVAYDSDDSGYDYSTDNSIRIWDVLSGKELYRIPHAALLFQFSQDGSRLLVDLGDSHGLEVWDIDTKRKLFDLEVTRYHQPYAASFDPDSMTIDVPIDNGTIEIFNYGDGKLRCRIPESASSAEYSRDGKQFLIVSSDATVINIWDPRTCRLLQGTIGGHHQFTAAHFSSDGQMVVASLLDSPRVQLISARTGTMIKQFSLPGVDRFTDVALSADGKRLLARWQIQGVQTQTGIFDMHYTTLWDVQSGQELHRFDDGAGMGYGSSLVLGFSQDHGTIPVLVDTRLASLWSAQTGKLIIKYQSP